MNGIQITLKSKLIRVIGRGIVIKLEVTVEAQMKLEVRFQLVIKAFYVTTANLRDERRIPGDCYCFVCIISLLKSISLGVIKAFYVTTENLRTIARRCTVITVHDGVTSPKIAKLREKTASKLIMLKKLIKRKCFCLLQILGSFNEYQNLKGVPEEWSKSLKNKTKGSQALFNNEILCPTGSVPILRHDIDKVNIARAEVLKKIQRSLYRVNKNDDSTGDQISDGDNDGDQISDEVEYAGVRISPEHGIRKIEVKVNVWHPTTEVNDEYTRSEVQLVAGSGSELNVVGVGWLVKDDWEVPKLFGFSTSNIDPGGIALGRHNNHGFVQESQGPVYLGVPLLVSSVENGMQVELDVSLYKGIDAWWLAIGGHVIGYWSIQRFTHLEGFATSACLFGQISNEREKHGGLHTKTKMGSGKFAGEGHGKAAYFSHLKIKDGDDAIVAISHALLEDGVRQSKKECYNVDVFHSHTTLGAGFFYGGSGYNAISCT